MTREEWLNKLAHRLRPLFVSAGAPLPEQLHISCGWPTRRALATAGGKSRTIGQCFPIECSTGGFAEVFVSPCLSDAVHVGAVLAHELCHAALNCDGGHGPRFKRLALAIGLEGKMTSTTATPELAERLNVLCESIGPYPHAALDYTKAEKKQSTRLLKVLCPECGYTVRITSKWIDVGLPTCPCGTDMIEEGQDEDE
jgi:hypothetical protein